MELKETEFEGVWNEYIWLRLKSGSCEHINEPSDTIKGREFLE
jgi:hypothetical protein